MTDHELESLRERRKRELFAQSLQKELDQKRQEESLQQAKDREVKATIIIKNFLEPDGITYMTWLSSANPQIAQTIKDTIIMLIYKKALKQPLSKIDLMRIERELIGEESKIKIKRRGKAVEDLNESMRKNNI